MTRTEREELAWAVVAGIYLYELLNAVIELGRARERRIVERRIVEHRRLVDQSLLDNDYSRARAEEVYEVHDKDRADSPTSDDT